MKVIEVVRIRGYAKHIQGCGDEAQSEIGQRNFWMPKQRFPLVSPVSSKAQDTRDQQDCKQPAKAVCRYSQQQRRMVSKRPGGQNNQREFHEYIDKCLGCSLLAFRHATRCPRACRGTCICSCRIHNDCLRGSVPVSYCFFSDIDDSGIKLSYWGYHDIRADSDRTDPIPSELHRQ